MLFSVSKPYCYEEVEVRAITRRDRWSEHQGGYDKAQPLPMDTRDGFVTLSLTLNLA